MQLIVEAALLVDGEATEEGSGRLGVICLRFFGFVRACSSGRGGRDGAGGQDRAGVEGGGRGEGVQDFVLHGRGQRPKGNHVQGNGTTR